MSRPRLKKERRSKKEPPRLADLPDAASEQKRKWALLLRLLGYKPATTFRMELRQQERLRSVWILCERYRFMSGLDQSPTPAYFRDQFDAMIKEIDKLLARLKSMNEESPGLLAAWLAERSSARLPDIESNLASLRNAARDALASKTEDKSQGRPVNAALKELIRNLRADFARMYRGSSSTKRTKRGFIEELSPREKEELEFVRLALKSEHVYAPSDLGRLFREEDAFCESEKAREAAWKELTPSKELRLARARRRRKKGT